MSIATTSPTTPTSLADQFLVNIRKEIEIAAPLGVAWEAMLEEIGPAFTNLEGVKLNTKLEAWPGGRYYRDLGNNTGHLWGHVQVIKPPTLLEITGPLFMSAPVMSHVQYRFAEKGKGTLLTLTHRAFGEIAPEQRAGMTKGWQAIVDRIRDRAQR